MKTEIRLAAVLGEAAGFTPGPWEISKDAVPAGHVQLTVYAEADGERVATVFREEANADLIAAAPCLAEALSDLMKQCENWAPTIDRSRARAALSKAGCL